MNDRVFRHIGVETVCLGICGDRLGLHMSALASDRVCLHMSDICTLAGCSQLRRAQNKN